MTPPASPGQRRILHEHYVAVGEDPVAFIDETYHLAFDGRQRFYAMAAVVVLGCDRDLLRKELDLIVPDGWWHTTEVLGTDEGRETTLEMLRTFRPPDETCIVVNHIDVDRADKDGAAARARVLAEILVSIHGGSSGLHPPARLAVIEEHREFRVNDADRRVRAQLIKDSLVESRLIMATVSPGSEHLLWLPDLVCSAYRQEFTRNERAFLDEIRDLTHVKMLKK